MRNDERDPRIPEALITRPEFIAACAAHDISSVFALAERFGLSRSAISRMTEIKTDHVREIINGRRVIGSFAVYERIADGLGIPGGMLGLAPRSWELSTEPESSQPLGAIKDLQPWELVDAITQFAIGADTLAEMERSAIAAATRYPNTPPDQLIPLIARMTGRVHQALMEPSSLRVSRRCVQLAGILSGLMGHLNLDLGDRNRAAGFYGAGLIAGREAGDDDLTAWLLTMQSIGQFFEGDPTAAVEALEEAAQLTDRGGNARRHAWVCAQLARAHAANGSAAVAFQQLERSASSLEDADPPSGLDFFDGARLNGITGTCNLLMGRPDTATAILSEALAQRSTDDLKGRALLTLDLASCRIVAGEVEEACGTAESALDLASGSLVQPIIIRARELKAELQPWRDLGSVQSFAERLRADQVSTTMLEG